MFAVTLTTVSTVPSLGLRTPAVGRVLTVAALVPSMKDVA
jgi:hypothetical protein